MHYFYIVIDVNGKFFLELYDPVFNPGLVLGPLITGLIALINIDHTSTNLSNIALNIYIIRNII